MVPQKLSGMQKQVLALYRGFLRAARKKGPEERKRVESIISSEFRQNAEGIDRKNFVYIEYLIRRGRRQLDQLRCPDTVGLSTFRLSASEAISTIDKEAYEEQVADKPQSQVTSR